MSNLENIINEAFENRAEISPSTVSPEVREAVATALEQLDKGVVRVAEKKDGDWVTNQ